MKTQIIQSAGEFLILVGDDLSMDEIRHSLIYGVAQKVSEDTHVYGAAHPWFIVIEDQGQTCAVAMRTPPQRVILAYLRGNLKQVTAELVRAVHRRDPNIPGVIGDVEITNPFTERWCADYGIEIQDTMAQRIYRLNELVEPAYASGYLRLANLEDQEIVIAWATAFHNEAVGDMLSRELFQRYRERILNGDIFLWDDRGPVSMAAQMRPTQHGISIGSVYTPSEQRNHGYATSCVAALSKQLLQQYDFCTLYTDLSNPTSNSIYKKIGFKQYCDSVQVTFSESKRLV